MTERATAPTPEPALRDADDARTRTPLELARVAAGHLAERGVADARLDAELLLAHVLGLTRMELYLQHDRPLAAEEIARYRDAIRRRSAREPLQHIVGSVGFREIELKVDVRALIPRPETEVLVGVALEWSHAHLPKGGEPRRALDVGTGTGAIALSLLTEDGFDAVLATDLSSEALGLAAENGSALGLRDRLELRYGSVYEPLFRDERFDAIVSNPPYIAETERESLASEVVDWEPAAALFGGESGLDVVEPLVRGALDRLARPGLLALELAERQTGAVAELATACGFARVRIIEDLTGRPRIVAAETDG